MSASKALTLVASSSPSRGDEEHKYFYTQNQEKYEQYKTKVEGQKIRMESQGGKDDNRKLPAPSDVAFAAQGEWLYTVSVLLCKNSTVLTDAIHETVNKESQEDDRKMAAPLNKTLLPAGFTAHDNRKMPAPLNDAVAAQSEFI